MITIPREEYYGLALPVNQAPRVLWRPGQLNSKLSARAREIIDLANAAGLILDPWQQLAIAAGCDEQELDHWLAFEVGILVSRQNGKGAILEARELYGLMAGRRGLHTAHQFKTTTDHFRRVKGWFDASDWLRAYVKNIVTAHGEERIELLRKNGLGGGDLRFIARSRASGRGFTVDDVYCDEAQELDSLAMDALTPTLSTRPDPQIWYTGTVPAPANNSQVFTGIRDRGRAGGDGSLAWLEWSAGERKADPLDRDAWQSANPTRGFRIDDEFIEREQRSLTSDGFARERLSIWPPSAAQSVIPVDLWNAGKDPKSTALDPVAFAIEVSPDRTVASISAAGKAAGREDCYHVELIDRREGTGWVPDRIAELTKHKPCTVVISRSGPAASLIPAIEANKVTLAKAGVNDESAACGILFDYVKENRIRHLGQPELDKALRAGRKRPVGNAAWVWNRKVIDDIGPLFGITLALFGLVSHVSYPEPDIF